MRPKCPKCGHPLGSYATWRREVESHPFGVACAKCKWVRMVSRAAIIRLAVEPEAEYSRGYAAGHEAVMKARIRDAMEVQKPETCKWSADGTPDCDPTSDNEMRHCYSCGNRVEVVNG